MTQAKMNSEAKQPASADGAPGKAVSLWLPVLLTAAVLLGAVVIQIAEPPIVAALRNAVFDSYQRWRPRPYEPVPVRILDIDDASLERIGQWPWPRTVMAEIVDRLHALGAVTVAFDVMFAEPDRTSPAAALAGLHGIHAVAEALGELPDHDQIFAETIARGVVVTGFALRAGAGAERFPRQAARYVTAGDDPRQFLAAHTGAVSTLEILEAGTAGNGALSFTSDTDGVIRRTPMMFRIGEDLYPTLAAEALRVAQSAGNYVVKSSGASGEERAGGQTGIVAVQIGGAIVPTDPEGAVWLHYTRPEPSRYVPAWTLLAGEVGPGVFDGHIVFVGTSAQGLQDVRFSPLGGVIPGVEIHAQTIEQIMLGNTLSRPDWAKAAESILMVAIGAVVIVLVLRFGAMWSAVAGLGGVGAACYASWHAFAAERLLLDPVTPAAAAILVFLATSIPRHMQAERRQKWIRQAFASYVSPNLVQHLIDNPGTLALGGETRECTFVMTDLAGFTSLMEKFDPKTVVSLLNEYLDRMIAIAFSHDGTLDRIVGDAVAVMFSAPVTQDDHAARGIACALEMDAFADAFARAKQAEGIPFGTTRIGVNTGSVLVGNFGGGTMFDYRALGDPINTAARLESVNKQLGTRVCVSGSTVARCPGFVGRPVGTLVLKGKTEGIEAFEPLADGAADSPANRDYDAAYRLLKAGDAGARAAFAALADAHPEDALARFHLTRLERGDTGARVVLTEK